MARVVQRAPTVAIFGIHVDAAGVGGRGKGDKSSMQGGRLPCSRVLHVVLARGVSVHEAEQETHAQDNGLHKDDATSPV